MSLADTVILQPSAMYDVEVNAVDALEKCGHSYTPEYYKEGNIMMTGAEYLQQQIFKKNESDKERVVKILKGGFENQFGMSYDRFVELYNEILKDEPERLI